MKWFYYLHTWALIGQDLFLNLTDNEKSLEKRIVQGLEIDAMPADDLFSLSPFFYASEKLKAKFELHDFSGVTFAKVSKIRKGGNFLANFPNAKLPPHYWQLQIVGEPGVDDFSTWSSGYLIVSESALRFLRNNNVTHAEEDLIEIPFDQYFGSARKYFWMEEKVREYFIRMDSKKK